MTERTYHIGLLQVRAYQVLRHSVSSEVKKFGLNPTQWFILGQIKQDGKVRPSQAAKLLRVERPLVTSLTDDLVSRGLIYKTDDKNDKRVKLMILSPKGKKLIPEIESRLQVNLSSLLQGISHSELEMYSKVLKAIIQNGKILS